ncbi:FMN-dependent dehydrogenase-domain-containing protein [Tricharina praecox]|uniref:FMN-dependent dehydrogenase-domain-containing protein n=1 Tax=Tricharina praecox TaxID=43433 RepID=UPI002220A4B8|nr:FMN-dependent dehydrogenase-domain-containing protein [Tricharina praecox]KAI5844097.1 FMN-dependent dehydrogenase-domain-containing protein [Tricharina praecox]
MVKSSRVSGDEEVAKHNTRASCWVIIHNQVYDVTSFLDSHPGGANIILRYAGRDATAEYDPIHPPGTLEETLFASQILGPVDASTIPVSTPSTTTTSQQAAEQVPLPPLHTQLSLADFEKSAKSVLSPKAWAYYSSAADDEYTKAHNNRVFRSVLLRPRIFRDVLSVDLSTTLLGTPVRLPVFISPAALARLAHPSGEAGIAAAAGRAGVIQCVSNNASLRPEQISAAATAPLWFQLYVQTDRTISERLLARISAPTSGYTAIVLTLDAPTPGKREADERVANVAAATSAASGRGIAGPTPSQGEGLGRALFAGTEPSLTWTDLEWLRKHTHLPIILKGVQTHEDALLACAPAARALGVRGIILSNHGGRAADTAPPPLLTLLEIRRHAPQVLGLLEVYIDGGIRRGTDVVKALALGARAVGIGRPALFGLAGYGEQGVERVIKILEEEVTTALRLLGVNSVHEVGRRHVNAGLLVREMDVDEEGEGLWGLRAKL